MDDDLFDVARTLRPYLVELVGPKAPEYDATIVRLLAAAADGKRVGDRLADLLAASPAVRDWAARVIEDEWHRPPEVQPLEERAVDLPGTGMPVAASKYVCPEDGAYAWWRRSVGVPVRECPDHHVPLVPA
ncbi:hypothetical protein ACWDRB_58775 [Nonomuraea sp. NPDC003707]